MSRWRSPGLQPGAAGRLQVSGLLVAAGIGVEIATLFWNHPVSFFLFVLPGTVLIGGGMLLYVSYVVTGGAGASRGADANDRVSAAGRGT